MNIPALYCAGATPKGALHMTKIYRPTDSTAEEFHAPAFRAWARGDVQAAQDSASKAKGGYLTGEAGAGIIAHRLGEASVMRRVCGVQSVSDGSPIPFATQKAVVAADAGPPAVAAENTPAQASFVSQGTAATTATDFTYAGGALAFDTLSTNVLPVSRELLEDASVDLEREIIQPLTRWAGPVLNDAYTTGTGSSVIEGFAESSLIAESSGANTIATLGNPWAIGRNAIELLPRSTRGVAQFMGTFSTYSALLDALYQAWHRADAAGEPSGAAYFLGRRYIENEDITSNISYDDTRKTAAISVAATPALYCGDIASGYRIFDVGTPTVERFEDSAYMARRQVGFALTVRTAGRLVVAQNDMVGMV